MKIRIHTLQTLLLVVLLNLFSACQPPYDEYKDFLDGAWIVEEIILNDPTGVFEGDDALNLDQEKSKFHFDYSGNVRTPMGKRKFWFKEDHKILMIGDYQYLFSKIDENRFKIHLIKESGIAEVIYILRRIPED